MCTNASHIRIRSRRRPAAVAVALLACVLLPMPVIPVAAEAAVATEDQFRAGFLFQLAQYATWPSSAFGNSQSPLRFCVLGEEQLFETLSTTVRGKSIQNRRIEVSRAKEPAQLAGCHVAFIGFDGEKQLRGLFEKWPYPPVLLVGEAPHFAELGGMVNLVIQSGRVSFEINVEAAGRARLEFRSQLLRFAHIVVNSTTRGTQ
jgi:hypothetical protein